MSIKFHHILKAAAVLFMAASVFAGCKKDKPESEYLSDHDDAQYLIDGLVRAEAATGELLPIRGSFLDDDNPSVLTIPAASVEEAKEHFTSLAYPGADLSSTGDKIIWKLKGLQDEDQGQAEFTEGEGRILARVELPEACAPISDITYVDLSYAPFNDVNPDVRELLEDYYYYGAIVEISDHGCGSGKFVVLREYDFSNGAAGMAIQLGRTLYNWKDISEEMERQHAKRSSCRSTMGTAGSILNSDPQILGKQLANAGSNSNWDQHYLSNDRQWTGWHYYYNLKTGDYDTIGPFNDLDYYEALIYWFVPDGDHINFW